MAGRHVIRWMHFSTETPSTCRSVVPVVAHGVEDGIVKLNGPGNEQGRVRCLARHLGWRFRSFVLGLVGLLDSSDLPDFLLDLLDVGPYFCNLLGQYAAAVVVFEAGDAFAGEGRVQFQEWLCF